MALVFGLACLLALHCIHFPDVVADSCFGIRIEFHGWRECIVVCRFLFLPFLLPPADKRTVDCIEDDKKVHQTGNHH